MERRPYYLEFVKNFAFKNKKMAFVAGPRQVGKTTLAEQILAETSDGLYFNWDDLEFKRQWVQDPKKLIPEKIGHSRIVVFDELHKAPRWKSTLKGVYDLCHSFAHILVTGSAMLDTFRRGGDSLLGRYFLLRMHPFSIGELKKTSCSPDKISQALKSPLTPEPDIFSRLLQFGGFPDAYLKGDPALWNIWIRMRLERLIREDLLSLTQTHELALIESCATLLPAKVGSPFSLQSLAEDLSISHPTAKRWINWLSQLFYIYSLQPYARTIARSLKKQPKIYLWDWSEVPDEAARFENMVSGHLLKACHYWTDTGQGTFELFYVRDKEKREVDFLITRNKKPWLLAECKSSDTSISPHLLYYAQRLNPAIVVQVVKKSGIQERFPISPKEKGFLISADAFLGCF